MNDFDTLTVQLTDGIQLALTYSFREFRYARYGYYQLQIGALLGGFICMLSMALLFLCHYLVGQEVIFWTQSRSLQLVNYWWSIVIFILDMII